MDYGLPKGSYTFLELSTRVPHRKYNKRCAHHYALFIEDSKLLKESKVEWDFYRTGKYREKTSFQNEQQSIVFTVMHYWHEQHTLARKGKFLLAWSSKLGTRKKPYIQWKLFEELVILGSNTTRFNAQIYSEHMLKSHLQSQPESWMEPKTTNHLFPPMPVKIPLNAAAFKVLLEIT